MSHAFACLVFRPVLPARKFGRHAASRTPKCWAWSLQQRKHAGLALRTSMPAEKLDREEWIRRSSLVEFTTLSLEELKSLDEQALFLSVRRVKRELERIRKDQSRMRETNASVGEKTPKKVTAELFVSIASAKKLVPPLLWVCQSKVHDASSSFLANLSWALARLSPLTGSIRTASPSTPHATPFSLMRAIVHSCMDRGLLNFSGRDVAMIVWAAASLHRDQPHFLSTKERRKLLQALSEDVRLQLHDISPQGLAMILWALAVFHARDAFKAEIVASHGTFAAVAEEAEKRAQDLTAREVANIVWAFGTVHFQVPKWLMQEIPERAENFRPQHFANVFWALAITSQPMDDLVVALRKQISASNEDLSRWSAQNIANTAFALAHCAPVRRNDRTL